MMMCGMTMYDDNTVMCQDLSLCLLMKTSGVMMSWIKTSRMTLFLMMTSVIMSGMTMFRITLSAFRLISIIFS